MDPKEELRKKLRGIGQGVQNALSPLDAPEVVPSPSPVPAPDSPSNIELLRRKAEEAKLNNPNLQLMDAQQDLDAASLRSPMEEQLAKQRFMDLKRRLGMLDE